MGCSDECPFRAEVEKAVVHLRELEWPICADYGGYCRICQADKPYPDPLPGDGHAPDCALAAFLRLTRDP